MSSLAVLVFFRLTGGPLGDRLREEVGGAAEEEAAVEIARCLETRSEEEGLRREVELLDARCPGVWLLGIGGTIDSAEISFEKETDADPPSVGDGDAAAIF